MQIDNDRRFRQRGGFSIIEVIVVTGVIGLLIGVLLPAVQSAREASRRLQCANNLKQIGMALTNYESVYSTFPATNAKSLANLANAFSAHYYSPLARMLPYLDQIPLFNATNFDLSPSDDTSTSNNDTVMMTSIGLFLCPSDPQPSVEGYGRCNYRFNIGPTPWSSAGENNPQSLAGPFTSHVFYRASDFSDGTSNTVGISERCQGDWISNQTKINGDYILTWIGNSKPDRDADWALEQCMRADSNTQLESRAGESWFISGLHFTNYNHCFTPNTNHMDCAFDGWHTTNLHNRTLIEGVFSARSFHSNGVNAACMDGSVRFIKDSVSLNTWRALATRSSGDISATE